MPDTYYDSELTGEQIEAALEAIDGVVTPSNDGKVLYIADGKIKAASASRWSGGGYPEPTGTITITENGLQDVKDYAEANVQVQGGAVIQPLSITQNDTYNPPSGVDGFAPVTVNVSGGSPTLPSEYQQVAYIRSSGTQYIKTGVIPTVNTSVKIEIGDASDHTKIFCGSRSNTRGNSARFMPARGHGTSSYYFGVSFGFSETPTSGSLHAPLNTACTIEANLPGQIARNMCWDYQFSEDVSRLEFVNPIALFGCGDDNDTVTYIGTCSIGKCQIKDNTTNNILRDFVPCYRKADNVIGMYDLANDVFYTNQGTGVFTKGPDVN